MWESEIRDLLSKLQHVHLFDGLLLLHEFLQKIYRLAYPHLVKKPVNAVPDHGYYKKPKAGNTICI